MRRQQRQEEWQEKADDGNMNMSVNTNHEQQNQCRSPPPNRVAASPFADDDMIFYHNSDTDSDTDSQQGSPSKLLRPSTSNESMNKSSASLFGDAEDYINTMAGGLNRKGYYESFLMESPPSSKTIPKDFAGNLHHRHTTNHHHYNNSNSINTNTHVMMTPGQYDPRYNESASNYHDDESPVHRMMRQRPFLSPHKHHAIHQFHDNHNQYYWYSHQSFKSLLASFTTTRIVRWSFAIALSFYLWILYHSTSDLGRQSLINHETFYLPDIMEQMGMYDRSDCFNGSGYTRGNGNGCHKTIPVWYKEQMKQAEDARSKLEARKLQRRFRTALPSHKPSRTRPRAKTTEAGTGWHKVESLEGQRRVLEGAAGSNKNANSHIGGDSVASIKNLCGHSAQNSSLVSPGSYPASAALNKNSKVLITGILNPVGFSLALRLKQHCGVQHIWGVDAMYPNTVLNRLMAHQRMLLLNSMNSNNLGSSSSTTQRQVVLPYLGLDPKSRQSSSKSGEEARKLSLKDEMSWMQGFEPTHVVHLASYSMDVYSDALIDPEWKNTHSPYVPDDYAQSSANTDGEEQQKNNNEPYMFPLRSGMVAMEQLLQTIAEFPEEKRPQFLYATTDSLSSKNSPANSSHDKLFHAMKQMDELLVDTYHTQHGHKLPSIGLRLPNSIYGPWGQPGSAVHDILQHAVEEQYEANSKNDPTNRRGGKSDSDSLDLLYVEDAVDVIISALQHRSDKSMKISVPAERTSSVESLSSAVHSLLHADGDSSYQQFSTSAQKSDIENSKEVQSLIIPKTEQATLKDGLVKSIAWHKDRLKPYGPAPSRNVDEEVPVKDTTSFETGDKFLRRHDMQTCGPHDTTCHKNNDYFPCNSECNIHEQCIPSVFDDVQELLYDVSEGCDIVMYTQMLGYNVEDAELHAEYMDDSNLDDDELLVCNFAIVPRESDLVSLVTSKVPAEQLSKFGIEEDQSDKNTKAYRQKKLDGLNGRLLYRGWVLVWIKDGMRELSVPDASLLKLSPTNFFHPSVKYGLFVEDNFKVSPNLDDVLFLVDEMHRNKLNGRSLKKEEQIETPNGPIVKKVKYRIPEEPARRAAILFAPLRYPNIDDPIVDQYRDGHRTLTIHHASKFMGYEVGYQPGEKEPASFRRQREAYERIPAYINRNTELRSNFEPWYRYSMRHWVRSRWVVHDFTLEDARLLRCDWYQEHVQWGNDLDQLSFAKVMAIRDLKRRVAHQEPDDHVKSFIETHPELHGLIDSYEWHSMETEVNKLYREPINWDSQPPPSTQVGVNGNEKLEEEDNLEEEDMPLYVRIMSERVMASSRKVWTKMRKKIAKAKKESAINKLKK